MRSLFSITHVVRLEGTEGVSLVETIAGLITQLERRMGQRFDELNAKVDVKAAEINAKLKAQFEESKADKEEIEGLKAELAAAKAAEATAEANALSPEEEATLEQKIDSIGVTAAAGDPTNPTTIPEDHPVFQPAPAPAPAPV